jgi:hypothetical protein
MSALFNLHTGLSYASDYIVSSVERVPLSQAGGWTWRTGSILREPVAYFVQAYGGYDATLLSGDALGVTVQFNRPSPSGTSDIVVNLLAVGQP